MARFKAGSPEARERARRAARARWGRPSSDPVAEAAIAQPVLGARLSSREFAAALQRERELEERKLEAEAAKGYEPRSATSSSSSPAAAGPAESPALREGQAPLVAAGGRKNSPLGPDGSPARGNELPGSPTVNDRPVGDVPARPAAGDDRAQGVGPVAVAPRVTGPAMVCQGCDQLVRPADQAAHSRACRTQPQHEAAKWRPYTGKESAVPVPVPVTVLRHFCGMLVAAAAREAHRCPPGSLPHWGTDAEAWRAA